MALRAAWVDAIYLVQQPAPALTSVPDIYQPLHMLGPAPGSPLRWTFSKAGGVHWNFGAGWILDGGGGDLSSGGPAAASGPASPLCNN